MYKVRKLYRIVAPHFIAGVELSIPQEGEPDEWQVDNAAPIIRYMMGWRAESVMKHVDRKGWEIQFLGDETDE